MIRHDLCAGAVVLSGLLLPAFALCDDALGATSREEQVRVLEQEAQEAQLSKDLDRARTLRLQAFELHASTETALALGRTELESKRYRDSAEHLDYAVRMLPEAAGEKTKESLKKAFAEARAQIAIVEATTDRTGAEIRVDGKSVGRAPLARPIFLDPGAHEISAHFEHNSITRPVVVLAGQEYHVTLPLVFRPAISSRRPAPIRARAQTVPLRTNPAPSLSRSPIPLFMGGTLFVAGVASGIVFRLDSAAKYDTADEMRARRATTGCVGEQSRTDECTALRTAAESADRSRDWSTVGFAAAGAALVGTLAYWYWPGRSEDPKPSARLPLRPLVSPSASGLVFYTEY